jgi:GntR family transcriptional regulator of arabinose operon
MAAVGSQGVLLFPHDHSTAAGAVDELQRLGVAVVVVDRYLPGLPTDAVIFDDFAIGYEVTSAMLDRGYRYPAMLWSESDATSVRDLSPLAVVSARLPRGKWDGRPRA